MEKSCSGEKVNLPAEPTFASVYMRKKLTTLSESTVLAHAVFV